MKAWKSEKDVLDAAKTEYVRGLNAELAGLAQRLRDLAIKAMDARVVVAERKGDPGQEFRQRGVPGHPTYENLVLGESLPGAAIDETRGRWKTYRQLVEGIREIHDDLRQQAGPDYTEQEIATEHMEQEIATIERVLGHTT